MTPLVFHVASGQVFFAGVIFMVAAAFVSQSSRPIWRRVSVMLFLLAAIGIFISSTAIPYWLYAVAVLGTLPWILSGFRPGWIHWAPHLLIAGWLIAAAFEVPYHATPTLRTMTSQRLVVLGDSLTAGIGGSETAETWPSILAREDGYRVQDLSHVGETAGSALKRIQEHPPQGELVIVEIGGNDLLGSTTAAEFERDLNALLAKLQAPGRQIMMFELPLPPFCWEYGRVQRAAAKRHGVALVPKRMLLSVIADEESTLDTIHLTQAGHQRMADVVVDLLPAAPNDP